MHLCSTQWFCDLSEKSLVIVYFGRYGIWMICYVWGYNGMFVCCAGAARQCSKASRTAVSGSMHVKRYLAPSFRSDDAVYTFSWLNIRSTPWTDLLETHQICLSCQQGFLSLTLEQICMCWSHCQCLQALPRRVVLIQWVLSTSVYNCYF